HIEERTVGLLQGDLHGVGIDRGDQLNRSDLGPPGRGKLRILHPLEIVLDRFGVERGPVVKLHPPAQRERNGDAVPADRPPGRQHRHDRQVLVRVHEFVVQVLVDVAVDDGPGPVGIQRGRVEVQRGPQGPSASPPLRGGRPDQAGHHHGGEKQRTGPHYGVPRIARPYGSLPTPVTVATTARFDRSTTHTVPLGGAPGGRRGPPETTAYRPSEVTAVPLGRPGRTVPSRSGGRGTGMRATSAPGSCARARRRSTIDTLFPEKLATMICRPSGVQARVKGRVWPPGSSVPTRTRATSALGAPMRARSTSM